MSDELKPFPVVDRYPELREHFHEGDVRVAIAAALFVALIVAFCLKLHYASAVGFKECSIDQFFDPILTGVAGALTTIIGFYFGDRRRN